MYVYHVCALKFAEDNQTIFYDTRYHRNTSSNSTSPKESLLRRLRLNDNRILESLRPCAMMATSSTSLHSVHLLDSSSPLLSSVLSIAWIAACKEKLKMKTDWQFQSPQSPRYMQSCDKLLGLILERLTTPHQSCRSPCFSPT